MNNMSFFVAKKVICAMMGRFTKAKTSIYPRWKI